MKKIPPPLHHLERPEVSQLLLSSGHPPRAVIDGEFETVGEHLTTEEIVGILFATGGSRYLEELGPRPTTWKLRLDGVGVISVSAAQHGEDIEAQFLAPIDRVVAAPRIDLERPDAGRNATTKPERRLSSAKVSSDRAPTQKPPRKPSDGAARKRKGLSAPNIEVRSVDEDDNDEATPFELEAVQPRRAAPVDDLARAAPASEAAPAAKAAVPAATSASAHIERLIAAAREEGASDLHVVAGRPPLVRALGELSPRGDAIAPADVEAMVRACVPERLVRALEETGSCDFAMDLGERGRFRVNVARHRTGLKIGLRFIALEMPTLVSLGLPPELAAATRHHQGLVVVTGPTGHGKTCTLAALVDLLNRDTTHHVITVEDPVEYVHPRRRALISQREVGAHTRSFASALKASLREDPDVIVVGELRDTETVRMALAASETGHLVLGTMNTVSAAKTIDRLIDLFPPADQQQVRATLAGGLKMVVSQRLLPRLDRTGMACAVELLPGSIALWNLIRDSKTLQIPSLMQRGKGVGVLRLNDSLADLVQAGVVDRSVAAAVSDAPDELEVALRRPPPDALTSAARVAHQARALSGPGDKVGPQGSKPPPAAGLFQRAGALFGKKGS